MQGLADGYFILPYTVGNYLANTKLEKVDSSHPAFREAEAQVRERVQKLLAIGGRRSADEFHRALGKIMWDLVGMSRTEEGLKQALTQIRALRQEFWQDLRVPGEALDLNQELEKAGRVADFFELAELIALDALERRESCGGHFREEFQTPEGEAQRDDANFAHVAVWEYQGDDKPPLRHTEPLLFEVVELAQRSYK
jgi:succinate dehydrogenase / fumarate reductase flavoprotein subunit